MKTKNLIGPGSDINPDDKFSKKATRGQYIMYFIYLCLLIVISIQQLLQITKIEKSQLIINNSDELRELLMKPLEGEWKYSVKWSMYNNDTVNEYISYGTAFFIWDCTKHFYTVYIAYSIQQREIDEGSIVTAFLQGTLKADERGYPDDKEIIFEYKCRTSIKNGANLGIAPHPIKMQEINFKMNNNKILQIDAKYEFTKQTKCDGIVTFTK